MRRIILNAGMVIATTIAFSVFTSSCLNDDDETIVLESGSISGIPADSKAKPNPSIEGNTTVMPNVQYTVEDEGNNIIIRLDMTGVRDANGIDWIKLYGTGLDNQNVWVEVDGTPKGILVINSDENDNNRKRLTDLVFLVDNSGSMDSEADAIARDIRDWAQKLEASNLDIRFGCVGYSVYGTINGALDITDATTLGTYLDRSYGTNRTVGFTGANNEKLKAAANSYKTTGDECGGQALRYADEQLSWRSGANRIYVNFTDEPNQPGGIKEYSTEYFRDAQNWPTYKGTVHTVYSANTSYTEQLYYREYPWNLSTYTGGTFLTASSSFTGVTLESLPVTGALQNSYIIRFTNIRPLMDGKDHVVKITIVSADGKTTVERIFYINFGTAQ